MIEATVPAPCISLTLPWPPSLNAYYRSITTPAKGRKQAQARAILSAAGRGYRGKVAGELLVQWRGRALEGPIAVHLQFWPPDRRRRDLDNLLKCLLDALAKGGVYGDDSQIRELHVHMGEVKAGGEVGVLVKTMKPAPSNP